MGQYTVLAIISVVLFCVGSLGRHVKNEREKVGKK
jgi:hypothetical protein